MSVRRNIALQVFLLLVTLVCLTYTAFIPPVPNLTKNFGLERNSNRNRISKTGAGSENAFFHLKHPRHIINLRLNADSLAQIERDVIEDQIKTANIRRRQPYYFQTLTRVRRAEKATIGDKNTAENCSTETESGGSWAISISELGKSVASAISNTGSVVALAMNGSLAEAIALSTHKKGNANATSDTHGEGGAKSSALAKETGNVTSSSTSRGTGDSKSVAVAMGGGQAQSDSVAHNGGNSTAASSTNIEGNTSSNSVALNGSSSASALSRGLGHSSADSVAGAKGGQSNATASSLGGNVLANSRANGGGLSSSVGTTNGTGDATANAISLKEGSQAKDLSALADSIAEAQSTGEFPKSAADLIEKEQAGKTEPAKEEPTKDT